MPSLKESRRDEGVPLLKECIDANIEKLVYEDLLKNILAEYSDANIEEPLKGYSEPDMEESVQYVAANEDSLSMDILPNLPILSKDSKTNRFEGRV